MIRKATRQKAKLRIGLSAPSGSGKTYSAILLAEGLATSSDKICLIDTENGRGDLYSHLNNYNIITLTAPFTPERYIACMKEAEDAGMEVIIIDSISHEWEGSGGLLESNEQLAKTKYKGNTWFAWSDTTPRHQKFIEKIISSPCHIITTVRNKVDTIMTEDKKVKKVGTKEITREGFEYEVTVNFNIDRDTHTAIVSKDNTELFEGKNPFIISVETGKMLKDWADQGVDVIKPTQPKTSETEKITPPATVKATLYQTTMKAVDEAVKPETLATMRPKVEASTKLTEDEKAGLIIAIDKKVEELTKVATVDVIDEL